MGIIIGRSLTPLNSSRTLRAVRADLRGSAVVMTTRAGKCRMSVKAAPENFQFVPVEFLKHVFLRTVELDNGGLLTAATESFDEVFASETVDEDEEVVRFTTEGKIVDQRFRKVKP